MSPLEHPARQVAFPDPHRGQACGGTPSTSLAPVPLRKEEPDAAQRASPGRPTVGISAGSAYSTLSGARAVSEGRKARPPERFRVRVALALDAGPRAVKQANVFPPARRKSRRGEVWRPKSKQTNRASPPWTLRD